MPPPLVINSNQQQGEAFFCKVVDENIPRCKPFDAVVRFTVDVMRVIYCSATWTYADAPMYFAVPTGEMIHDISYRSVRLVVRRENTFTVCGDRQSVHITVESIAQIRQTRVILDQVKKCKTLQAIPLNVFQYVHYPGLRWFIGSKTLEQFQWTNLLVDQVGETKRVEFWINVHFYQDGLGPHGLGLLGKFQMHINIDSVICQALDQISKIIKCEVKEFVDKMRNTLNDFETKDLNELFTKYQTKLRDENIMIGNRVKHKGNVIKLPNFRVKSKWECITDEEERTKRGHFTGHELAQLRQQRIREIEEQQEEEKSLKGFVSDRDMRSSIIGYQTVGLAWETNLTREQTWSNAKVPPTLKRLGPLQIWANATNLIPSERLDQLEISLENVQFTVETSQCAEESSFEMTRASSTSEEQTNTIETLAIEQLNTSESKSLLELISDIENDELKASEDDKFNLSLVSFWTNEDKKTKDKSAHVVSSSRVKWSWRKKYHNMKSYIPKFK